MNKKNIKITQRPNLLQKLLQATDIGNYLKIPDIENININETGRIWIQVAGKDPYFENNEKLTRANLTRLGEEIAYINRIDWDQEKEALSAKLPDGTRTEFLICPGISSGIAIAFRKRAVGKFGLSDFGFDEEQILFLKNAIIKKKTFLISGGTSTGKTTVLEILANMIPKTVRIVNIQDPREIEFLQPNKVDMTVTEVNHNLREEQLSIYANTAMRINPDRIIIGEIRDSKMADFFSKMINTGHEGSMATIHANSPQESIRRLANFILFNYKGGDVNIIEEELLSSISFVIQIKRENKERKAYFESF